MMKKKLFLMWILSALLCTAAWAVPAKPGLTKKITLTSGTEITARLVGDEFAHYWVGPDGKAYQDTDGDGFYEQVDAASVQQKASARRSAANQRRLARAPKKVGNVGSITGDKKGIIILVNFKNKSFTASQSDFNNLANTVNYNSGNYKGSMYDYFYAQSEGQFRLTFDVVGPYTVSQNYSYYGGNDSSGNDQYPAKMVIEALQLANADVDFSDYDWDGDGEVDQVYVVYAGKGEADGGSDDTIWPHEWELSSAAKYGDGSGAQTLDGVRINTYACGGEQNGQTGATAGIGTMCHEFSHCLGYPDFYDTDYSGGQGMFMWDLMDSGSYNGDGYRPAGYTSYERWVAGWKTPTTLETTQTVSNKKALQDTGSDTYIIYNKANNNEYYLLENRQKKGWDTDLPGAGLLIIHVDYNSSVWSANEPNDDPSHQRMTWIPADNQYQTYTYNGTIYVDEDGAANDPFPYGNINAFGRNTTPAATLYNANSDGTYYLDSSVENITQNSNGTITFNFVGVSNVATPTFSLAAGRYQTTQTVSISCETSGATIRYTTDGSTPTTSSSVYSSPLTISQTTTVKAIAVKDGDQSAVASATYKIGATTSNPNTTTFSLVTSTDDLEDGLRYVIACGSKFMAAGAHNTSYLGQVQVSFNNNNDVLTATDNVAVFVLEQGTNGWTFKNEDTDQYLISTAARNVSYSSTAAEWTLSNGTEGVIMTMGDYGTMLYNNNSPRFTTYTSTPTAAMIQANLYVEDSSATPVTPDPFIVADETVTFSTTVGTPQTKTFEVMSEGLTEDITVTLSGTNSNLFSLGSSTISRSDSELGATGSVTFTPTAAGTFTATLTLTSAGADPVTISLSATATEAGGSTGTGETLFYEGVTGYTASSDSGTDFNNSTSFSYLDYTGWNSNTISKVYPGGTSNAYDNGGCLKFGSSSAIGTITTGSLSLTGSGTLTFYLKKYGSDTGKMNLTVTGADADVTQFTPTSDWTQCTVNLTNGDGAVTITFATTARRAYVDEITLTSSSGGTTPVTKEDVTMSFSPTSVEITQGDTFTAPTLMTDPSGLTVTYESSNTDVATVNASTGAVTVVGTGTTTITATFAGNDSYNNGSASYTLTVNAYVDPNAPGGENDPYTVAEARAAITAGTGVTGVYATGIVSAIVTAYNSQYGNITYDISDDGTTSSDQLRVYRGKSYNGDNFTSADDIQVGDEVVVYGNLILYGTDVYEFAEGNQLISLVRAQKQDVTMSFSPTTATATVGEDFTEPTLSTTPAGLDVTYSSSATGVATVDPSTGEVTLVAAGTTTITASFAGNASYNPGTASYELTVSAGSAPSGDGTQLLYESLSGYTTTTDGSGAFPTNQSSSWLDYDNWDSFTRIYAGGTNNAYTEGGCLKFGSGSGNGSMTTGDITLTGDATLTFYLKKYGTDTGTLNVTVNGASADVTQFTPSGTWTLCTVNLTNATGTVTITFATSTKRAYLDEIKLETVAVSATPTITADPTSLTFTADVSQNQTDTKTITVTAANLTAGITAAISGTDAAMFSVSPASLTTAGGQLTVTYTPTATGTHSATLTLSSTGATDVTITLSGTAEKGSEAVAIGNYGLTTLYTDIALTIPWDTYDDLLGVFYAKEIDSDAKEIKLGRVTNNIPALTAVIVQGNKGTYTFPKATTSVDPISGNILQGVLEDTPVSNFNGTVFTLQMGSNGYIGFYRFSGSTLSAKRAFVVIPDGQIKQMAGMNIVVSEDNGETTYIDGHAWTLTRDDDAWYTLDGRKLNSKPTTRGLYILNGKKVLFK